MIGENPQLELRPGPESVGRFACEGPCRFVVVYNKTGHPTRRPRPEVPAEGGPRRTGHGRERCKAPMVRDARWRALLTMRSRCKSKMQGRPCKSPVFRL